MEESGNWLTAIIDSFNGLEVTPVNSLVRLILSMFLGMIIGAERKRKGQVAGVRTFALISMGSCLAMLLSIYVPQEYLGLKNGDPGRIAAQVITGVGFLGGGAMIHLKGAVRGLTTAAGIWMTAIIGMAVGIGMYTCGILASLLCVFVLVGLEWSERRSHSGNEARAVNVVAKGIITDLSQYLRVFEESGIHVSTYYVDYDYDNDTTHINFLLLMPNSTDILPVFEQLRKIVDTHKLNFTSQIEN